MKLGENDNAANPGPEAGNAGQGSSSPFVKRALALEKELKEAREQLARRQHHRSGLRWSDGNLLQREEEEGWLTTYLDMMTLLLVLLLVMLAFSGGGVVKELRERTGTTLPAGDGLLPESAGLLPPPLAQSGQTGIDPTQGLALEGLDDDIQVLVNERSVSLRINSEILFDSAQADLSLEGLSVLRQLIPVIRDSKHLVAVEGHTDAIPIRSIYFPSNWELSSARAGSVVRYLEANGIESARLRAVGYANTRPLATNDTAEGRSQNRRVELVLEMPENGVKNSAEPTDTTADQDSGAPAATDEGNASSGNAVEPVQQGS